MGARAPVPLDRIVAVIAELADGRQSLGTGFLVSAGVVLTARHCTLDRQQPDRPLARLWVVRDLDGDSRAVGEVRRCGAAALDVAVLLLAGPHWSLPDPDPGWAAVDREHAGVLTGCQAAGYPDWQWDPGTGQRSLAQFEGEIRTLEDASSGLLVMRDPLLADVAAARPDESAASASPRPWGGLSGAAVLHQGRIIGVVVEHHRRQGGAAIRVLPISRLAAGTDPGTRSVCAALGLPPPGDLPSAADPAGPIVLRSELGEIVPPADIRAAGALAPLYQAVLASAGLTGDLLRQPSRWPVPTDEQRNQIEALAVAHAELEQTGQAALTAEETYRAGMLAAYGRDVPTALALLRRATELDPELTDAHAGIAWLQQARGTSLLGGPDPDLDAADSCLAEAREAGLHTDPTDVAMLALRGFIEKSRAQVAEARGRPDQASARYAEAAHLFAHAVEDDATDPSAWNGLGNVRQAAGDLDGAIDAYRHAVALAPGYAAAHHDLALALADRARAEPSAAAQWLAQAVEACRTAYELAPEDPGFDDRDVVALGRWLASLRAQLAAASGQPNTGPTAG
jgi:hypothetical protein